MTRLDDLARPAVADLLHAEEEQLYEQLGLRLRAIALDPAVAGSFDPAVIYDGAQMGAKEDILALGKRIFKRWSAEAHQLLCGSGDDDAADRARVRDAFGSGESTVAAIVAGLLVSHLGIAPALAAVIAAIACKRFFRPAFEEFCAAWSKAL
jgi:hypothetical protein